ncbi:MAG: toll/interleukin-1 receptor domain-containing protein [Rubrivivax sp.]|nr:toll/interleukin-1 receptor domain-containing protein [Rubrivivax sp.]
MAGPVVFISYRRADTQALAERLHHDLARRYGEERVFFDREDIHRGDAWRETISRHLQASDLVLALIGPRWLAEWQQRNAARVPGAELGSPAQAAVDDVLHVELSEALRQGKRVIPVLVNGAELPSAERLSADLRGLLERQAGTLRESHYEADLRALLSSAHVPWTVGLAWSASTLTGWIVGMLALIFVLMAPQGFDGDGAALPGAVVDAGDPRRTHPWPGPHWLVLSGAVFGLAVGASQWIVLRVWLPLGSAMLWQTPLLGAALMMLVAGSHGVGQSAGKSIAILALLAVPFCFGLLLWSLLRPHMSRAGWFTVAYHSSPLLALLVAALLQAPGEPADSEGAAALLGLVVASGGTGAMLVWLLRQAGARRR